MEGDGGGGDVGEGAEGSDEFIGIGADTLGSKGETDEGGGDSMDIGGRERKERDSIDDDDVGVEE